LRRCFLPLSQRLFPQQLSAAACFAASCWAFFSACCCAFFAFGFLLGIRRSFRRFGFRLFLRIGCGFRCRSFFSLRICLRFRVSSGFRCRFLCFFRLRIRFGFRRCRRFRRRFFSLLLLFLRLLSRFLRLQTILLKLLQTLLLGGLLFTQFFSLLLSLLFALLGGTARWPAAAVGGCNYSPPPPDQPSPHQWKNLRRRRLRHPDARRTNSRSAARSE
jgi:hypothetical protein